MKRIWLLLTTAFLISLMGCGNETTEFQTEVTTSYEEESTVVTEDSNESQESATSKKSYTSTYSADDTWAVYWYMCGSDLESGDGDGTADLEELMSASLPDNVKVIVQTGGASAWMNDFVDESRIQRYVYQDGELEQVDDQPQANMGEQSTLEEFLTFCEEGYPADHKVVLFWNHGGGSVGGVAYDENYDYDSLELSELAEAFSTIYPEGGQPFELVGFDACLMATLDTAVTMKDYASFMVASEELEPGNGWQYEGWLSALGEDPSMNGAQLGTVICNTFVSGCEDEGTEDEVTLSVLDLTMLDPLVGSFQDMGTEILTSAVNTPEICGEFARSAEKAENYGGNNEEEGYCNMVDLGDLVSNAEELLPETAEEVIGALEDVVVYKVNGAYRQNANGLSVYYPYNADEEEMAYYDDLAEEEAYQYFIHYSVGDELPEEAESYFADSEVEWGDVETIDGFSGDMPTEVTEDNYARLVLTPEDLYSVKSVYFNLAYYMEAEDQVVYLGSDNDLTADWDNGVFEDNFRGVWGALDGVLCYVEITYEGDDYNLYSVPIYLNGTKCIMRIAYDYNTEEYSVLGAKSENESDTTMGDKNLILFEPGDEIVPVLYSADLNSDSQETSEIENDAVIYSSDSAFTEMELDEGTYAYQFEVVDTANDRYDSDVLMFDFYDGEISYLLD